VLAQIVKEYPNDVRFVYRHFPLNSIHDKAALGMQASEAAGVQGKFWEMYDVIFGTQSEWIGLTPDQYKEWLTVRAGEIGLDVTKFNQDLTSPGNVAMVNEAWEKGQAAGLSGTPFILINNQPYQGQVDIQTLKGLVEWVLLDKRLFTECPEMTIDPNKQYIATLETEKGDIVIELFAKEAPLTVNSFVFLARQGWFDNTTFHRVIPGFVAQGGDPSGSGYGGPGYEFNNEVSSKYKFDRAGLVAMANSGPNTNGSQFFITYGPASNLDGQYTIFGEVISGYDIAQSLTPRDPSQGGDLPLGDKILSVTIEEK
jgi:cyclophilin family peptidyl-prolyl cis-trans isomerase